MESPNFALWVTTAAFGSFLGWVLWKKYLPLVRTPLEHHPQPQAAAIPPAWLFCEEGSRIDRRVQWFPLRAGGRTVIGGQPRAETPDTLFVYLAADDIEHDHAVIAFDPEPGRYLVSAAGRAVVLHNNEVLPPGEQARLSDGDTLDFGQLSRFRFLLSGPNDS
jgi:hypothetical protein